MDILSFSAVLIYLTTYFLVEKATKKVYRYFSPSFYDRLLSKRDDLQFFVFIMGILITLFSTPICLKAYQGSSNENDVLGKPFKSRAGEICIASKGILWTSELIRLDHSVAYVMHHLSSLGFLVSHLVIDFPLRPTYALFASLVTELASDTVAILRLHGKLPENSSLAYKVQTINTFGLILLRVPTAIYAATFLPQHSLSDPRFWMNFVMITVYLWFLLNLIYASATRLCFVQRSPGDSTNLLIFQRYHVSLYSIFFALGSFIMAISSSKLYIKSSPTPLNTTEISRLNTQLILTGFTALFGAYNPYQSLINRNATARNSLWIQSAVFTATLGIFPSLLVDRYRFFLALALVLPLGEAVGRIGCHFAGCCGGPEATGQWIPIQLRSSAINGALGIAVLFGYELGFIQYEKGGVLSLAINALIRLALRANVFAVGQLIFSLSLFVTGPHLDGPSGIMRPIAESVISLDVRKYVLYMVKNGGMRLDLSEAIWIACFAASTIIAGGIVQRYSSSRSVQDFGNVNFTPPCEPIRHQRTATLEEDNMEKKTVSEIRTRISYGPRYNI
ncbi:hypothetical protein B0O99DRAFT_195635 [Bisporella sp. PMI_857]|nr:hypothetical protein B0O99DRAFT_195635 [Bisporella sp. PMI_857]